MALPLQTLEEREAQVRAELAMYPPMNQKYSYNSGFIGGHQSIGSWFTSGLTGLLLSKGASDNEQRKWYVQRNGIQFGKKALEDSISAYEELSKYRKLTQEELKDLEERKRRDALMQRDLEHVFNKERGNLDAPMDAKGQSFNDRWGVNTEDEGEILKLLKTLANNPAYAGGVFTAEILKDLPLSVLAWLGLTAKGAAGANSISQALNKLNNIQPAALRGLAKMGTGIGAGGAAGAGYEALYTKLDQGDVKGKNVKAGAAFGSAFGVLAGLGVMARTSKGSPKAKENTSTDKAELKELQKQVIPPRAEATIKKNVEELKDNPDRVFPDIREGRDYRSVDISTPAGRKIADDNGWGAKGGALAGFRGIQTIDATDGGLPWLVTDKAQLAKTFRTIDGDVNYKDISPMESWYLQDFNSWQVFMLAREKGKIKVAKTQTEFPDEQTRDAFLSDEATAEVRNSMIIKEREKMSNSDVDVEKVKAEIAANTQAPEEIDINTTPSYAERVTGFFDRKPNMLPVAAGGAAIAGYALGDKEEGEPFQQALAAGLAVGLGPKAYKALKGKSLNVISMRIKKQVSENLEISSEVAKAWEAEAQRILDNAKDLTPLQFDDIVDAIEGNRKVGDDALDKIKDDIQKLLTIIGKEAEKAKIIKSADEVTKLDMRGMYKSGEIGPFLNNYFPHLFEKVGQLTPDDLVKIYGKLRDRSDIDRSIRGTRQEILKMQKETDANGKPLIDPSLRLLDPKDTLSVYIQAMSRTIIGKNALNSMRGLSLGIPEGGKGMSMPALLTLDELEALKKDKTFSKQEGLHYLEFEHPALKGYAAHTNIHHVLNDFFAISHRGNVGDMAEKVLKLNNGLKRVFVFGSLFHAQALFMSGVYSLGISGAVKGMFGKGALNKNIGWEQMQLGSTDFADLAQEALLDGLQIVNIKKQELTNPGQEFLRPKVKYMADRAGPAGKYMIGAFDKIDTITWEYLHDRFKLAVYLKQKQKLIDAGVNPKYSGIRAAEFANDAFGSLDWNNFTTRLYDYAAKNPDKIRGKIANRAAQLIPINKRRWLNLGLFAPDWTISNIRIVAKTFTGLPKVTDAMVKRFHKGNWEGMKESQDFVKAWNMYAAYSARAGLYTSALWWAMTEAFSSEDPSYEGLWDFWTGENSGKLDLGDGESMVISKQIAEPIHWLQHPTHTFMNKTSVVPKTALEAMFNKQWFSLKKGMPLGPRLVEEDGTQHYAKWILGKTIPIVGKSVLDEDLTWTERFERTFTGFFGFPQYGDPEDL